MRTVPERAGWLQLLAVFGGFLAGPAAALRASEWLAPGSGLIQGVATLGFAAVFAGGAILWLGLGVAAVVLSFLAALLRGRSHEIPSLGSGRRLVPPGYGSFVVLGVGVGLLLGLLSGFATPAGLARAVAGWTMLGGLYGGLLWAAAHHGLFPFDPE